MSLFLGCGAAMITPFGSDGINFDALARYTDSLIQGGVSALLPFGTTGEPATVTQDEYDSAVKFIIERAKGEVPVIIGAGSNSTRDAAEKAEHASNLGADGILSVTPYYNKCTQKGLIEHYKIIVKAAKIPVIAYNVPTRTGVNISPSTLPELKKVGIAGLKEASGDIDILLDCARVCNDIDLDLYCGDDSLTTVAMAMGAKGVISVAANAAPRQMTALTKACLDGDFDTARAIQFELAEFIHALFCEVNPIPIKKAMNILGFDAGIPRLPLTELEPEHTVLLETEMKKIGLI